MPPYGGPTIGRPSKATPSTQCQKCLKRGHYTYECKAAAQERPYVSRPSRTQQLLNPKLRPELHTHVPEDLLRKKGVADEELAKKEREREKRRKREASYDDLDRPKYPKRARSRSESVSSVSTISTNKSRSRSRSPKRIEPASKSSRRKHRRRRSRSPRRGRRRDSPPARGRRDSRSASPANSYSSYSRSRSRSPYRAEKDGQKIEGSSKSVSQSRSPPRRTERERRELRDDVNGKGHREGRDSGRGELGPPRSRDGPSGGVDAPPLRQDAGRAPEPPRERSLSPFSKRVALTKQMGGR